MRKRICGILLTLAMCLSLLSVTAQATDKAIVIGGLDSNVWFTKYGNVYMDCQVEDFQGAMGFSQGDLVTVKFLDRALVLPVVPTYSYVDSGKPAVIAGLDESGAPTGYLSLAINMGNFAETYGLAVKKTDADGNWYWEAAEGVTYPVEVTFEMAEQGGYLAEYLLRDLSRTNDRGDYPHLSDADFANFRPIRTTGVGAGALYRTSSPVNPEIGRDAYAMKALEEAGVTVIMNLADSQEAAQAYEGFAGSYYADQQVIYLNLGVDFAAEEFQSGLAKGLRFFAENEGIYALHCNEGKDRAGFVSALLECLMGASLDEVVTDYMRTYENYYGVEPGSEKYQAIAESNIVKSLSHAFGVDDLTKADLAAEAEEYIRSIGLTGGEIDALKTNLGAADRAAILTILHRLEGSPDLPSDYEVPTFADVDYDTLSAPLFAALRWAAYEGIVDGYGSGALGLDDPVTREQLATLLWRYAKYKGYDVSVGEETNILSYEDAFDVGQWAVPAMQWACGAGVLEGKPGGLLDPKGGASHAQVAMTVTRLGELDK